jgi:hypothetical protein
MNERAIKFKTSLGAYVVFGVIASPFLVVLPVWMGRQQYFESGYWVAHLILASAFAIFFLSMYQEIWLFADRIVRRRLGLLGWSVTEMNYVDVAQWVAEHPYRLINRSGVELVIPWTTFSKRDRQLLFDSLNAALASKKVEVRGGLGT